MLRPALFVQLHQYDILFGNGAAPRISHAPRDCAAAFEFDADAVHILAFRNGNQGALRSVRLVTGRDEAGSERAQHIPAGRHPRETKLPRAVSPDANPRRGKRAGWILQRNDYVRRWLAIQRDAARDGRVSAARRLLLRLSRNLKRKAEE